MKRILMVFALLVACVPAIAHAQATPEASPEAASALALLIPDAGDLGDGWFRHDWVPDGYYQPFIDQYAASFGGPKGQRAVVIIAQHRSDRKTGAGAWEVVEKWLSTLATDYVQSHEWLPDTSLPDQLSDGRRLAGFDVHFGFPLTAGTYAIGDELVMYVVAPRSLDLVDPEMPPCDQFAVYAAERADLL
jgi:hypothetical protein